MAGLISVRTAFLLMALTTLVAFAYAEEDRLPPLSELENYELKSGAVERLVLIMKTLFAKFMKVFMSMVVPPPLMGLMSQFTVPNNLPNFYNGGQ